MAKQGAIRAGQAYVELFADTSPLVRGLRLAEARLLAFGKGLQNIGRTIGSIGLTGTLPFGLSAMVGMEFSDAMLAVKAATESSGDAFEALRAKARELGRTTSYSATEAANAMLELARAGFKASELGTATEAVLNLARATGTEVPLATSYAAAALRQFNLESKDIIMVSDVLVATANASALSLEDLGESMKYVGPVAMDFGMSLQDAAKAIGTLSNMGIKGSMAGTSLRQMLLQLSQVKTQETLRGMKVEVLNASRNFRSFGDIMIDIGKAMTTMPVPQRLALFKELFDQRAVTAALKLSTTQFDYLSHAIDNAAGTAARQAAMMDSELGGAWRRFKNNVFDLAIAIEESLRPTLLKLSTYLTENIGRIAAWVAQNQQVVVTVASVLAGMTVLGPAIVGVGAVFSRMAGLLSITTTSLTALGTILTPAGILAGGLVAIAAYAVNASGAFDAFGRTVSYTMDSIVRALTAGKFESALDLLKARWDLYLAGRKLDWDVSWRAIGTAPTSAGRQHMTDLLAEETDDYVEASNRLARAEMAIINAQRQIRDQRAAEQMQAGIANLGQTMAGVVQYTVGGIMDAGRQTIEQGIARVQQGFLQYGRDTQAQKDLVTAWGQKAGEWLGQADAALLDRAPGWMQGLADQARKFLPEGLEFNVPDELGRLPDVQDEIQSALTGAAALRLGGITAGKRAEERTANATEKMAADLAVVKGLAKTAKLVFTGALPG